MYSVNTGYSSRNPSYQYHERESYERYRLPFSPLNYRGRAPSYPSHPTGYLNRGRIALDNPYNTGPTKIIYKPRNYSVCGIMGCNRKATNRGKTATSPHCPNHRRSMGARGAAIKQNQNRGKMEEARAKTVVKDAIANVEFEFSKVNLNSKADRDLFRDRVIKIKKEAMKDVQRHFNVAIEAARQEKNLREERENHYKPEWQDPGHRHAITYAARQAMQRSREMQSTLDKVNELSANKYINSSDHSLVHAGQSH